MTYLITLSTYGAHLHGDERGSVDRDHNQRGSPALEPRPGLRKYECRSMVQSAYLLDESRRAITANAVHALCSDRGLHLFALYVRTNHLHVVVEIEGDPKAVALDLKRYASRAPNQSQLDYKNRKRWARGSSVRLLRDRDAIDRAIHYVAVNQGEPMALFVAG